MRYKKVDILVVDKAADRVTVDRPTDQAGQHHMAFAAAGRTVMVAGTVVEIVADSRQEHPHHRMEALALVGLLQLNSDTFHPEVLLLVAAAALRSFDCLAFVRIDKGTVLVPIGLGYCSS